MLLLTGIYAAVLLGVGGLWALSVRPLPDRQGAETEGEQLGLLGLALGWGFGVVPALAFMTYLAFGVTVGPTSVLAWALASALASMGLWWRRGGRSGAPLMPIALAPCLRAHRVGLILVAAIGLLYALRWDRHIFSVGHSCIHQVGLIAAGALPSSADVLRDNIQDARLGNPAVIAAFIGLFHGLGPRLLYGGCGLLIALGAWTTGVRLGGRLAGLLAAPALALSPWLLKNPLVDENLLALAVIASFAPWLLGRRAPWATLGLLAGLALGMRHVLVLAVPAWLLAAMWANRGPWRGRAVLRFGGFMALATLPWHLHHHLAMGSVLRFESFGQVPAQYHDFGFGPVLWEGMLNWPFYDTLVRTPHNPFPTAVLWPLWLLDHLGTGLCALAVVGSVVGWRRGWRKQTVRWLWWLPLFAALAVQEKWDDPNKMGVGLLLLWPLLEWGLTGARAIVRRPSVFGPAALSLALLLWWLPATVAQLQVPADPRYGAVFPEDAVELPELLMSQRQAALEVGLLPDWGRVADFRAFDPLAALRQIATDAGQPALRPQHAPWGWPPEMVGGRRGTTEVGLSLQSPPWRAKAGESAPGCAEGKLIEAGAAVKLLGPFAVPWSAVPVTGLLAPTGAAVPGLLLLHGDYGWLAQKSPQQPHAELPAAKVQGEFQWLLMGDSAPRPEAAMWRDLVQVPVSDACLRLRLEGSDMALAFAYNLEGTRHLVWRGQVAEGRLRLFGARQALHN